MTGKRPRALSRTASVSQLGSGSFSQEFSPLPENPKEKLKQTIKEASPPALSAPRVVIGFDPKPGVHFKVECAVDSPKSAPCSPCFNDKASSPRSVLNSLFSRQRCVKPSDGVGLGIALHAPTPACATSDVKISIAEKSADADHIAIPVRDDFSPPRPREIPVAHSRRHSHPIPTPGISACHFTPYTHAQQEHERVADATNKPILAKASQQPVARPVLGWMEPDSLKVDRRDTFLLGASPARNLASGDATTALTDSSHFLDECSFCKRHLPADKDIFMYRYASSPSIATLALYVHRGFLTSPFHVTMLSTSAFLC